MAFKSPMAPKNICIKFALTTVESNWNNNFVINVRQSAQTGHKSRQCSTKMPHNVAALPFSHLPSPHPSSGCCPPANANWKRAYRRASEGWPEPGDPNLNSWTTSRSSRTLGSLAELHFNAITATLQLFNAFNYICWLALNVFIINRINIDIGTGSAARAPLPPAPNTAAGPNSCG